MLKVCWRNILRQLTAVRSHHYQCTVVPPVSLGSHLDCVDEARGELTPDRHALQQPAHDEENCAQRTYGLICW